MQETQERDVLRRLGAEMRALSQRPEQQEKREGWKRINSLQPNRPMLWITEIPWEEFEDDVEDLKLQCTDPELQRLERGLRRSIFTAKHLPCDEIVDDTIWFWRAISGTGFGVQIQEQQIHQGKTTIRSHHFEPVIKDMADVEKIRMPQVAHDADATAQRQAFLESVFGDAIPVKPCGPRQSFFNGWDDLVRWTGVTEALMDLVMRPDYVHALMRRLTDCFLARMDQYEAQGLLDWPHPLKRVGSGAAGFTDELPRADADPSHIRTLDQWGGATPQIFSDVSPDMHAEFALRYEIEVMQRCGLNYYGCCEPLHNKMDILAKVPRLRKISISPWCDTAKAAEKAHVRYVFSHKPNPAILAEDRFNVVRAEQLLRERIEQSGGMPCEIIMKDISTVRGDVERVIEWCRMAYRVVTE